MANERARGLGYKYITDDKYLVNPFSPTEGISYEGDGSPVSYANSGIMNQAPIPEPLQYIPRDGGNDNNNDDDDNINPYTGPSVSPWEAAKAAGLFALNPPAYLLQKIASKGIRAFKDYRNKNKIEKYTQEPMSNYRDDRPSSEKNYTGGDTNSNPSTPGAQDSFSNKSGMGRTGYFFGGRVNYKAGGETAGPGDTGGEGGENPQDKSDTQFGGGNDNNNGGGTKPTFYNKNDNIITTDFISQNPNLTINYADPRNFASVFGKIGFKDLIDNDDITANANVTGKFGPIDYNAPFTEEGLTGIDLTAGKFNANLNPDMQVQNIGYKKGPFSISTDGKNTRAGLTFSYGQGNKDGGRIGFKNGGLASIL